MPDNDLVKKFAPRKREIKLRKRPSSVTFMHMYLPAIVFVLVVAGVALFAMSRGRDSQKPPETQIEDGALVANGDLHDTDVPVVQDTLLGEDVTAEEPPVIPLVVIIDTPINSLNVRSGPSTGFPKIGKVTPGDEFVFIEESAGWFHVQIDSDDMEDGWVTGEYASLSTFGVDVEEIE